MTLVGIKRLLKPQYAKALWPIVITDVGKWRLLKAPFAITISDVRETKQTEYQSSNIFLTIKRIDPNACHRPAMNEDTYNRKFLKIFTINFSVFEIFLRRNNDDRKWSALLKCSKWNLGQRSRQCHGNQKSIFEESELIRIQIKHLNLITNISTALEYYTWSMSVTLLGRTRFVNAHLKKA